MTHDTSADVQFQHELLRNPKPDANLNYKAVGVVTNPNHTLAFEHNTSMALVVGLLAVIAFLTWLAPIIGVLSILLVPLWLAVALQTGAWAMTQMALKVTPPGSGEYKMVSLTTGKPVLKSILGFVLLPFILPFLAMYWLGRIWAALTGKQKPVPIGRRHYWHRVVEGARRYEREQQVNLTGREWKLFVVTACAGVFFSAAKAAQLWGDDPNNIPERDLDKLIQELTDAYGMPEG